MRSTGQPRFGRDKIARLTPADQARFERLRASLGRKRFAAALGVAEYSVERLEGGGYGTPTLIDRVVAALGRMP